MIFGDIRDTEVFPDTLAFIQKSDAEGTYLGTCMLMVSEISVSTVTSGAPYIYTVDWAGRLKLAHTVW